MGLSPARPADPVAIRVYTRGAEAQAFSYVVISQHGEDVFGEVTSDPRATCLYAGGAWDLEVHAAPVPKAAEEPVLSTSGDATDMPVDVWISGKPDGALELGRGVPEWWVGDRQECQ